MYFTNPGFVPFVVMPIVGTMRCVIPVVPGGDGAETEPLETRTERCSHRAEVLVGSAPTCTHHLLVAAKLGGIQLRSCPAECRP